MPEGPEIRRVATRIHKILAVVKLSRCNSPSRGLQVLDPNCRVSKWSGSPAAVEKALLTRFEDGLTIYSHNQLYGRWYVTRRDNLPRTNRTFAAGYPYANS